MDSDAKAFYLMQYKWIRIPHPSLQVAKDGKHPLHQIELEISHCEHIVHNLIQDVMGNKGNFKHDDVTKLIKVFEDAKFQLELVEHSDLVDEYKLYINSTLDLLVKADALVR
ncbi:hypothetical protein [Deinococcus aluminii]|uniref:hypothetical protein n=1 Tax=Deinococcus aluminii TaxID=1656885 RepID=UPI0031EA5F37